MKQEIKKEGPQTVKTHQTREKWIKNKREIIPPSAEKNTDNLTKVIAAAKQAGIFTI